MGIEEKIMIQILPRYLRSRFLGLFFFCLLSVVVLFLVVDLVENLDQFIDKKVSWKIVLVYYLYFLPYTIVLVLPVATLMASVFSVGNLAKHNEIVAMKSLGYSLYRVIITLLGVGFIMSILSFIMAEGFVAQTNRKKEEMGRIYLSGLQPTISSRLQDLEIQEPPDKIITIGYYDGETQTAFRVKVETFQNYKLISRVDASSMYWDGHAWVIPNGYKREFEGETERAFSFYEPETYHFQFNPKELLLAQVKPDEMSFQELRWFVKRVRQSGGEVYRWMTELHLRIAFPLSNVIIVLFSVPLAYNRRKKNTAVGIGISLAVCFFYFGLVKMGQTLGQSGSVHPIIGAWLGNIIMIMGGVINLAKTRK